MIKIKSDIIDKIAKKRESLPEEAGLSDMMLYHTLTALYAEYREGMVSKENARREKARAIEKHRDLELWERIYKYHSKRIVELSNMAQKAFIEHSCPLCVKMYDIFSGYRGREQ